MKNEEAEEETVMEEGGKEEREEREGESVSEVATVQDGEGTMEEAIVGMETEVTKEEEDMTIKQSQLITSLSCSPHHTSHTHAHTHTGSSAEMPRSVIEPSSEIITDDVITDDVTNTNDVIETNNDIIPDKEKEVRDVMGGRDRSMYIIMSCDRFHHKMGRAGLVWSRNQILGLCNPWMGLSQNQIQSHLPLYLQLHQITILIVHEKKSHNLLWTILRLHRTIFRWSNLRHHPKKHQLSQPATLIGHLMLISKMGKR